VEEVVLPALPLGAPLRTAFDERTVPFHPGDTFVLHTDGIYESLGADGSPYGMCRLAAVVGGKGADVTAEDLRDAVLRDLSAFRGAAVQEDDVTLVVMKVRADG